MTVSVELLAVEGRKLTFAVAAHDGIDMIPDNPLGTCARAGGRFAIIVRPNELSGMIAQGRHERFIIDRAKFAARVAAKSASTAQ